MTNFATSIPPIAAYKRHAAGKRAIVWVPTLVAADFVCEMFNASDVKAEVITGSMSLRERDKAIDRFRAGETLVLVNCIALISDQRAQSVAEVSIIMTPTNSQTQYQMQFMAAGENGMVLDCTENWGRHGIPPRFRGTVMAASQIPASVPPVTAAAVLDAVLEKPTDAEIIEWLERQHTLHRKVEALYCVDVYNVTITHDCSQIAGPWEGATLRDAYIEAMNHWDVTHGREDVLLKRTGRKSQ